MFTRTLFLLALLLPSTVRSVDVETALQSLECSELLDHQIRLKTTALEGWTLQVEDMDGGMTHMVTRVLIRANSPLLAIRRKIVEDLLGTGLGRSEMAITGTEVLVLYYHPGVEISPENLQLLRRQLHL